MENRKLIIFLSFCLLMVLFALGVLWWPNRPERFNRGEELLVYFLEVGQGDSIFIRTPTDERIIIDGGPDNRAIIEMGKHLPFYDQHIDLMVLTHSDADHLTGLIEMLRRYPIEKILTTEALNNTAEYFEWQELVGQKKIEVQIAQAGQEFSLGGVDFKVLHPLENLSGQQVDNLNNSSLVLRMDYNENCFLFAGDIEEEAEEALLKQEVDLECDVLKVPHHGSNTGSTKEFLLAVQPDYAIIQSGKNNFGMPSKRVIYRLQRLGANVLNTYDLGEILLVGDSQALQVRN